MSVWESMASAGPRAYNGDLGTLPTAGFRGRDIGQGVRGCRDPVVGPSNTTDLDLFTRWLFTTIFTATHTQSIHQSWQVSPTSLATSITVERSLQHVYPRRQPWNVIPTVQSISRAAGPPTVTWSPSQFQHHIRIDSPAVKWWSRDVQVIRRNEAWRQGITRWLVWTMD